MLGSFWTKLGIVYSTNGITGRFDRVMERVVPKCSMQPQMASGMPPPVGSAQWWRQPERYDASADPDTATAQTIRIMCQHIKGGAGDWGVREAAMDAMHRFSVQDSAADLASAAWYWCKTFIKFAHHELLLRRYLGEANHLQGLISPDALIRMDKPEGDCAIFTDCLCAFLRVFGVPYELVTVAVNPAEPDIYSHVFAYAVLEDGRRFPCDASHGTYPGWQVPSSDVSRRQVWDSDGNPVPDRGSRFEGLGNYGLGRRGLGALVCLDPNDQQSCYEDGSNVTSSTVWTNPYGTGVPSSTVNPDTTIGTTPGYTVPPAGSAAWAGIASQLIKGGMTLAQINAIQPGTVVSANGAILRQSPGFGVPVGGGSAALTSLASSSMMPWLLGLGLVGFGLVAFAGSRR
jgi:hypothetical protein